MTAKNWYLISKKLKTRTEQNLTHGGTGKLEVTSFYNLTIRTYNLVIENLLSLGLMIFFAVGIQNCRYSGTILPQQYTSESWKLFKKSKELKCNKTVRSTELKQEPWKWRLEREGDTFCRLSSTSSSWGKFDLTVERCVINITIPTLKLKPWSLLRLHLAVLMELCNLWR